MRCERCHGFGEIETTGQRRMGSTLPDGSMVISPKEREELAGLLAWFGEQARHEAADYKETLAGLHARKWAKRLRGANRDA